MGCGWVTGTLYRIVYPAGNLAILAQPGLCGFGGPGSLPHVHSTRMNGSLGGAGGAGWARPSTRPLAGRGGRLVGFQWGHPVSAGTRARHAPHGRSVNIMPPWDHSIHPLTQAITVPVRPHRLDLGQDRPAKHPLDPDHQLSRRTTSACGQTAHVRGRAPELICQFQLIHVAFLTNQEKSGFSTGTGGSSTTNLRASSTGTPIRIRSSVVR